jgi:hypothetical protein
MVQEAGGTVLCCNGKARRWSDWETFLQRALTQPFGDDVEALRKLHVYMLVGNPDVVQRQAGMIGLRRPLPMVNAIRKQLRKIKQRRRAKSPSATEHQPVPPSEPKG